MGPFHYTLKTEPQRLMTEGKLPLFSVVKGQPMTVVTFKLLTHESLSESISDILAAFRACRYVLNFRSPPQNFLDIKLFFFQRFLSL